jgi:very-short-patch-repair endonuclease
LWNLLRNRQLTGHKFRRQVPIGRYIVDFLCFERGIIVELDGGQHQGQAGYDYERTQFLESGGYRVLRFWNNQIFEEIDAVQEAILIALEEGTPSPEPSPRGRGNFGKQNFTLTLKGEGTNCWGEGI